MIYLMNSAMMPTPGLTYRLRAVSRSEFSRAVGDAVTRGQVVSAIGYEATAAHIGRVTGYVPALSRSEVSVSPGDMMLICKLKYRVSDPRMKADPRAQAAVSDDDFEYFICEVLK